MTTATAKYGLRTVPAAVWLPSGRIIEQSPADWICAGTTGSLGP